MKQLVLTTDKQPNGENIHTLLEINQEEGDIVRFPWNAQSLNQIVLNLLVEAIAEELGAELKPIDLVEIGGKIAEKQGIEFRRLE